MRIKAFSLIELIIVILLLGIVFSLALVKLGSKGKYTETISMQDIPLYIKRLKVRGDMSFVIYDDKCDKEALVSDVYFERLPSDISFYKSSKVYMMDDADTVKEVEFDDMLIDKKERHICFKLDLRNGKFTDKFILETSRKYLLFLPIFQAVKVFTSFSDAKQAYLQSDLIPKSIDDYYNR